MSKQERLTQLIQMIYAKHPAGGALHIVLDDGNTEDRHIQWCIDHLDEYAAKDEVPLFLECARLLLSIRERHRGNAIYKAFKEIHERRSES